MSYAMASVLQQAVYQRLQADAALAALVGEAIFDAAPAGAVPDLYVTLGPEDVRDAGDKTGAGARHDFTVSVVANLAGFAAAKDAAAAVSDALSGAVPVLARGRVVALNFLRARARRMDDGAGRRIDLRFRARVEDD